MASDGTQLLLKTSKASKPKPEGVTLPQWISANAHIEAELMQQGELATLEAQQQYCRYIRYLGKVKRLLYFTFRPVWPFK